MLWPNEKITLLKEGWFAGKRGLALVEHMQGEYSRADIIVQIGSLNLTESSKAPTQRTKQNRVQNLGGTVRWTDAMDAHLRQKWDVEGWSASLISDSLLADLGAVVSRSAVLGRVHRLGLNSRQGKDNRSHLPRPRKKREPNPAKEGAPKKAYEVLEDIPPPECRKISMMELTETTCRCPIGDPLHESFSYCGIEGAKNPSNPYCRYHARLSIDPNYKPRNREDKPKVNFR